MLYLLVWKTLKDNKMQVYFWLGGNTDVINVLENKFSNWSHIAFLNL
jgi:hypothetical protein